MTTTTTTEFGVRSEARGPHWVAWLTAPGQEGPHQSVLLVGRTQEEAEAKAREWIARVTAQAQRGSASSGS